MVELQFRLAQPADGAFIAGVQNEAIPGGRVTAQTEPYTAQERTAWLATHAAAQRPVFIAELAGEPVGMLSLSDWHSRQAYAITAEISVYLPKTYQGQGLGRQILAFADKAARQCGIEVLLAVIYHVNTPSLALFTKAGYTQWGYLPHVARHSEGPRDICILGKRL